MKAFYLHYNKPQSKKKGRNILTIHYEGKCHLVHDIDCKVPLKTRHRKTQPRCVLCGTGVVSIENGVATISRGTK